LWGIHQSPPDSYDSIAFKDLIIRLKITSARQLGNLPHVEKWVLFSSNPWLMDLRYGVGHIKSTEANHFLSSIAGPINNNELSFMAVFSIKLCRKQKSIQTENTIKLVPLVSPNMGVYDYTSAFFRVRNIAECSPSMSCVKQDDSIDPHLQQLAEGGHVR
jgi:hypothetical protein